MENFIKKRRWIKILTRDIPFIRLVMIYESYTQNFKKDIGLNYPAGLSISGKNIFSIYRDKKGVVKLGNDFCLLKNKKSLLNKIFKSIKKRKNHITKTIQECENKLKQEKGLNTEKYIAMFQSVYGIFKSFWCLQWFPVNLEISLEAIKRPDLIKRYQKSLVGIREENQYLIIKLEALIDNLLQGLAKQKAVSKNLIFYATPSEIIKNKISSESIIERKKFCLLGAAGNTSFIYTGDKAKKIARHVTAINEPRQKENPNLINGQIAYKGLASGRVKIIKLRKDLKNIKDKKIIVASMTEAYYTPYLKKVKAIITDEGGITCHAAIISRELGIPCIIGTKIATQVLKDGDLIEVDANNGVVKILK